MTKEQPSFEAEQEKNREWARGIANNFHITLDATGENFIVPLHDAQGKERGKEIIPAWHTIPFKHKGAVHQIEAEKAILALQNHPELNLSEALEKDWEMIKYTQKQ
jgi:hypothetical protein